MVPIWLTSIPADVVGLVQRLPQVLRRLDEIAEATRALPEMLDAIERLGLDTRALPALSRDMARIAEATDALPQMQARMDSIERAMPVLVEVQQHLARMPDTIETLGAGLTGHGQLLDRLLVSLDHLDENVAALRAAVQPLGRIAERLPGASRR